MAARLKTLVCMDDAISKIIPSNAIATVGILGNAATQKTLVSQALVGMGHVISTPTTSLSIVHVRKDGAGNFVTSELIHVQLHLVSMVRVVQVLGSSYAIVSKAGLDHCARMMSMSVFQILALMQSSVQTR